MGLSVCDGCEHLQEMFKERRENFSQLEQMNANLAKERDALTAENARLRGRIKQLECLKDICECGCFDQDGCYGCNAYEYCKSIAKADVSWQCKHCGQIIDHVDHTCAQQEERCHISDENT